MTVKHENQQTVFHEVDQAELAQVFGGGPSPVICRLTDCELQDCMSQYSNMVAMSSNILNSLSQAQASISHNLKG